MARTKGMLNLSGNIEVLAGVPFDARDIVPTKADLTVAANFPYPYVGMETYVIAEDKKYRYKGGDITQITNWSELNTDGGTNVVANPSGTASGNLTKIQIDNDIYDIPGGGTTYNDFIGATSSAAGTHGLVPAPAAGDEDKVLKGDGTWGVQSGGCSIPYSVNAQKIGTWLGEDLYQIVISDTTPNAASGNVSISGISFGSLIFIDKLIITTSAGIINAPEKATINSSGNAIIFDGLNASMQNKTFNAVIVFTNAFPDLSSLEPYRTQLNSYNSNCMTTAYNLMNSGGINQNNVYTYSAGVTSLGTLLWTNSNTSIEFADGLLQVPNINNYNAIVTRVKFHVNQNSYREIWSLGIKNLKTCAFCEAVSNANYGSYREFTFEDGGVRFGKGQGLGSASGDHDANNDAIPIEIYGFNLPE